MSDNPLDGYLEELVERSGALTALLIAKEGTCSAEGGDLDYFDPTGLAALVAGMFSATREVAKMIGEPNFSLMLQQGESRHLHISLVGSGEMMVVIFEDRERSGRVRYEARKTAARISEYRAATENRKPSESLSAPEFKEYALNLIDRIFAD
jgi:predicted regulator of Ras-like GTPase activity (Roadblock/LC7/MglB family)